MSGTGLSRLPDRELRDAWCSTLDELLDPRSPARRSLDPALAAACGLSQPALIAGLDAMLSGFTGRPAERLIERTDGRSAGGLAAAVLASNVPGLAVQVVLPALVARRPLIVKSSSREPFFAAALVHGLAARSPTIGRSLAAVTWAGGDRELEAPLLATADVLVAYGRADTLSDLRSRYSGRFTGLGPGLSIAVVSSEADASAAGHALARDVALFEQRGCLSVQTVFTDREPASLATALTQGLEELAKTLPPPPLEPSLAARIQQVRHMAELVGEMVSDLPLDAGTVLISEPGQVADSPRLEPLPGGRTVRVRSVRSLDEIEAALEPWRGAVQGAALAGDGAWRLAATLEALGLTRFAAPGELQHADALWANGDRHLVDVFSD
jgi:hypothetical protein